LHPQILSMIPENIHLIGQVTKLHGFRGELTIFLDTSKPSDYADIEFFFLERAGEMIPYRIELLEQKTRNSAKVKLEGVNDEETARLLLKSKVYVDQDVLTEGDDLRRELKELQGYRVIDQEHGELGDLHQVLELAGNPQLEIRHPKAMILLPMQDEFILGIDHDKKEIRVASPPGLIELFVGE